MVDLRNSHNTTSHTIEHQGCGAHQAAPESLDDEGTGDTPHHHCMTYIKRTTFTPPTYTNAHMLPNTRTIEPRLAYDNAPQYHSDRGIDYTICNNRIMIINNNPQTQTHLCNRKELDPHLHPHGQYHLPHKNTNIPLALEPDPAIRQDAYGSTRTTPSGPTLAYPTTNNRNLLAPPTTCCSPHSSTPACHNIAKQTQHSHLSDSNNRVPHAH